MAISVGPDETATFALGAKLHSEQRPSLQLAAAVKPPDAIHAAPES